MIENPASTPADVSAEDGEVFVEGPDGIKYSFTPDAAVETSDRLLNGGMEAKGQMLKAELQRSRPETGASDAAPAPSKPPKN